MNKTLRLAGGCLIAAILPLTSCCKEEEPDPASAFSLSEALAGLEYDSEGIWEGWNQNTSLILCNENSTFDFSHEWTEFSISQGFVASKSDDTGNYGDNGWMHQFTVVPGKGTAGEGSPFIVGNWNSSETDATAFADRTLAISFEGAPFIPVNMTVTNTCYAYYTMRDGNSFSTAFSEGDWFTVTAHGVHADGTETTSEFRLADCTGSDKTGWFVTDWTVWDLSSLGEVTGIYFTFDGSDTGAWGLNTPAYFAIGDVRFLF